MLERPGDLLVGHERAWRVGRFHLVIAGSITVDDEYANQHLVSDRDGSFTYRRFGPSGTLVCRPSEEDSHGRD